MDNKRRSLVERIEAIIEQEGVPAKAEDGAACIAIPFSRYMELCLYDSHGGYYRSGSVRTGKHGDFYTSSAVGGIMGELLARFVHHASASCANAPIIAEWGAGTGAMSCRMLEIWSDQSPEWLGGVEYWAVDDHPQHRDTACAQMDITMRGRTGARSIAAIGSSEAAAALAKQANDRPAIVIANELLDAMPVHRVEMRRGQLVELGVRIADGSGAIADREAVPSLFPDEERRFAAAYMPLSSSELTESVQADGIKMREGQQTEINLAAERWIADMGALIGSGMLVIIDYGHDAVEYRGAHRMSGTLLCYRNHLARSDPYLAPGEQDITAHINTTAIKRAAVRAGWNVSYESTQLQFLTEQGILGLLANHNDPNPFGETARRNRAIRQLLLSDSMSEAFKVVVLTRGDFRLA